MPGAEDLPLPALRDAPAPRVSTCRRPWRASACSRPGERALVPTGFRIELPAGYEAQVRPRSGLALRHGIVLPNAPGTIDSDYRGELRVILWNTGPEPFVLRRGDRVAQLVVAPVARAGSSRRRRSTRRRGATAASATPAAGGAAEGGA